MSLEGLEGLSKKLAADLRDNIRMLASSPVLSHPWIETAEKLFRIANASEMEKRLPKGKGDGTLWEGEELALRFLLEDGKVNLCLRLVDEYQRFVIAADAEGKEWTGDDALRCARFEYGVGVMLANCWMHKEALQTTDLPLLAQVATTAATRALKRQPMAMCAAASFASTEASAGATSAAAADGGGGGAAAAATSATAAPAAATGGAGTCVTATAAASAAAAAAWVGGAVDFPLPPADSAAAAGGRSASATSASASGGLPPAPASIPKRALEGVVLTWMMAAGRAAVGTFERKIVTEFIRAGVFEAMLRHVAANHARIAPVDLATGLEGLALLVASEEFATNKARAVASDEGYAAASVVKVSVLEPFIAPLDPAARRKVRPLVDWCAELIRKAPRKA